MAPRDLLSESRGALTDVLRLALDHAEQHPGRLSFSEASALVATALLIVDASETFWVRGCTSASSPEEVSEAVRPVAEAVLLAARARRVRQAVSRGPTAEYDADVETMKEYLSLCGKVLELDEVLCISAGGTETSVRCSPPAIGRIEMSMTGNELGDALLGRDTQGRTEPMMRISILEPHPAFQDAHPFAILGTIRTAGEVTVPLAVRIAGEDKQLLHKSSPGLSGADLWREEASLRM